MKPRSHGFLERQEKGAKSDDTEKTETDNVDSEVSWTYSDYSSDLLLGINDNRA